MDLHPNVGQRFHKFVSFVWPFLNLTQREILEQAGIRDKRRATLWRASVGESTGLTLAEARRVVFQLCIDPVLQLHGEEVWSWVIGETETPCPRLSELLVSTALYPHPRALRTLETTLEDFDSRGREQIICAAVPKLSALPETVVMAVHRNCLSRLGAHGRRIGTGLNNHHRVRRRARLEGRQGPAKQTHLVLESNLCHFRDGTGPYAGLPVEDRAEGIEEFATNAIDSHGDSVGVIDDAKVPADLLTHLRSFDGIFITDDRFLMKVHPGGVHRTTCVNIGMSTDAYIRAELARLNELKRCVTHGWTRAEMKDAVLQFMPI